MRVNGCDTAWCEDDIGAVMEGAADKVDSLVVPKVEGVDHVHFVESLLDQIERKLRLKNRVGLELLIESARGVENISRDAPLMAIGEGTNDILRTVIARQLVRGTPP